MGQHNRQRRAAKQRIRSRAQRAHASGSRAAPGGAQPPGSAQSPGSKSGNGSRPGYDFGAASGGNLLPVLAARVRIVDDTFGELFPDVISRPVGVSNASEWGAGRAAADLAELNSRDALPPTERRTG